MKNALKKPNISRQSLVFALLFAVSALFMLWKLPYGLGGSDEAFYLTVPYRLYLGDRLFFDEWHLSQLASFFTLPFVTLYLDLTGSTEGIMLAARCVYAALHALCALVIYLRLKNLGALSIAASILFMLFTPFDMMCYSYNTLAVDALALAGVFAGTARPCARADYVLAGAFFAAAVVCCPYLVSAYVVFALAVLVAARARARREYDNAVLTWRAFGLVTCGAAIMAALFAVFFFSHCSIDELLAAMPGLFTDPEHPKYSLWFMIKHYAYCLLTAHRWIIIPLGLYVVSLLALIADKSRRAHAHAHLALAAVCALLCFALFSKELVSDYYNAVMLPLAMPGFTAYLLLENKPRALFTASFALGVYYSACVCATSNMGFDVLSMAFAVVDVASCAFLALLLKERADMPKKRARILRAAAIAPLVCMAALVVTVKAVHCFWDAPPKYLDHELDRGPARGIITSERLGTDYERVFDDMQSYAARTPGKLLIYAPQTWCTLALPEGYECASFSAWLSGQDERTEARLALYYDLNVAKFPDYVYVLKDNAFAQPGLDGARIFSDAEANGFTVEENDVSWKLARENIHQ